MTEPLQPVSRALVLTRGLTCRCPNCGRYGLYQSWFRLGKRCRRCDLDLAMEEGFYSGTTSIGYVLIIGAVLGPVLWAVLTDRLTEFQAVAIGIVGTVGATVLLYPALLSWVLMNYYLWFPHQLPANGGQRELPPGQDH